MEISEILGYLGLAFIAVSFFFSKIVLLRALNLVGALIMAVYGFMIDSYPVAVLNIIIALLNIYHLNKILSQVSRFDLLNVSYERGDAFDKLYQAYEKDILQHFPEFSLSNIEQKNIILTLRDFTVSGAFVYTKKGPSIVVDLDYVVPKFRDGQNVDYLMTVITPELRAKGVNSIICKTEIPAHTGFLEKQGYKLWADGVTYEKEI